MSRYEVHLPYHQYLVYYLEADSAADALAMVERGYDKKGEPLSESCSLGCGPNVKPKVFDDGGAQLIPRRRGKRVAGFSEKELKHVATGLKDALKKAGKQLGKKRRSK